VPACGDAAGRAATQVTTQKSSTGFIGERADASSLAARDRIEF